MPRTSRSDKGTGGTRSRRRAPEGARREVDGHHGAEQQGHRGEGQRGPGRRGRPGQVDPLGREQRVRDERVRAVEQGVRPPRERPDEDQRVLARPENTRPGAAGAASRSIRTRSTNQAREDERVPLSRILARAVMIGAERAGLVGSVGCRRSGRACLPAGRTDGRTESQVLGPAERARDSAPR